MWSTQSRRCYCANPRSATADRGQKRSIILIVTTDAWRDWRAYAEGKDELEIFEDEAYSDRQFTGGPVTLGPTVLHAVIRSSEGMGLAVILQTAVHDRVMPNLILEDGTLAPADSHAFHGGTMSDEIAALVSLELGVRLRVAGMRETSGLHTEDDRPPIRFEVRPLVRPGREGRELLPRVMDRSPDLAALQRLARFSMVPATAAIELVRAAREYGQGIWWANEDPNQGWLHLVTAVEIAAGFRQLDSAPAVELLREHLPQLWTALEGTTDETKVRVANHLVPQMRATRRFVDFMTELAPEPPELRPTWGDLDWNEMRSHARLIYGHRSTALHAGKPFPVPMSVPPGWDAGGALQEAPWGLTAGAPGAIWERTETPMLLSTFEYIVRGALLSWWDELIRAGEEDGVDLPARP